MQSEHQRKAVVADDLKKSEILMTCLRSIAVKTEGLYSSQWSWISRKFRVSWSSTTAFGCFLLCAILPAGKVTCDYETQTVDKA